MRHTTGKELGVIALSFGLGDILSADPVPVVRFRALLRGKRRLVRLRAFKQALMEFFSRIGFVLLTLLNRVRGVGAAIGEAVRGRMQAGYGVATEKASQVNTRLTQACDRVRHVGAIVGMQVAMYSLLVRPMSRKGCVMVPLEMKPVEPTVSVVEPEAAPALALSLPMPAVVEPEPAPALALPMTAACRITTEPEEVDEKTAKVKKARKLMDGGMSQRKAAAEVGLSESTLRSILKRMK